MGYDVGDKSSVLDGGLSFNTSARIVSQTRTREIWSLCRQYDSEKLLAMGLLIIKQDQPLIITILSTF